MSSARIYLPIDLGEWPLDLSMYPVRRRDVLFYLLILLGLVGSSRSLTWICWKPKQKKEKSSILGTPKPYRGQNHRRLAAGHGIPVTSA